MSENNAVQLDLSVEEKEMVNLLQDAMGLESEEAVMRMLVRQAAQRIAITCPACGHYAQLTESAQAQCRSCLSVITLSEGIWQASNPELS